MSIRLQDGKMLWYGGLAHPEHVGTAFHVNCCCPSCTIFNDSFDGSGVVYEHNWNIISGTNILNSGCLQQSDGECKIVSVNSNTNIGSAFISANVNLKSMNVGDEVRLSPQSTIDGQEQIYSFIHKYDDECFYVGIGENNQILVERSDQSLSYDNENFYWKVCLNDNFVSTNFHRSIFSANTWDTLGSRVVGNSGDRASLYSNTTGTILWNGVHFQHYGTQENGLECPTCSGYISCINFAEEFSDENLECRWYLIGGNLPNEFGNLIPNHAVLPSNNASYVSKTTNARGANSHQRTSITIQNWLGYDPNLIITEYNIGTFIQIFCCDDGSLSAGAWAKLEIMEDEYGVAANFSIGIGNNTLRSEVTGLGRSFILTVCCENDRVSGSVYSDYGGVELTDTGNGFPEGAYSGFKFNNLEERLLWKYFDYQRIRNGLEDRYCLECSKCSLYTSIIVTEPLPPYPIGGWGVSPSQYVVPCYLLISIDGIQNNPKYPLWNCIKYNGQYLGRFEYLNKWENSVYYFDEEDFGWILYIRYFELFGGWYAFVLPGPPNAESSYSYIGNLISFENFNNGSVFKKFFGMNWNPEEIYDWNDFNIPRNSSLNGGPCWGQCSRREWIAGTFPPVYIDVDCTNPSWETTTCKITNVE
jgi:hypothetical protein